MGAGGGLLPVELKVDLRPELKVDLRPVILPDFQHILVAGGTLPAPLEGISRYFAQGFHLLIVFNFLFFFNLEDEGFL